MSRETVSVLKCMKKLLVAPGTVSGQGGAGLCTCLLLSSLGTGEDWGWEISATHARLLPWPGQAWPPHLPLTDSSPGQEDHLRVTFLKVLMPHQVEHVHLSCLTLWPEALVSHSSKS